MKELYKYIYEGILDDDDVLLDNIEKIKMIRTRYNVSVKGTHIHKYGDFIKSIDWRKLSNYLKKNKLIINYFDGHKYGSYTINRRLDIFMSYITSLEFTKDINSNRFEFTQFVMEKLKDFSKSKIEIKHRDDSIDLVFYIEANGYNVGWFDLEKK